MRSKELRSIALKLTDGLLRTVTDVTLFTLFLTLSSIGKSKTSVGAYQMFDEAQQWLTDFNYQTIKRTLFQLKKQGLISYGRGMTAETLSITKEGQIRLREIIPAYKKYRTWDGRLYLVTYDIPENQRFHRELLREFLKKLGGAMLQESVWLITYNPRETLRKYIEERNLLGLVIISDMGKDGSVGDEYITSLIRRIYKLDVLNKRYGEFIDQFSRNTKASPFGASRYLSILKDDPQLPFPLLPNDWLGDLAYSLFQKLYGTQFT